MANSGEVTPRPFKLPFNHPLLCRDITEIVLSHLSPGPKLDDRALPSVKAARAMAQRTLARVARVCRALSEHALDVLWVVVDDLVELLSVLPSFVKVTTNKQLAFGRDITQDEWSRSEKDAQRVRVLHFGTGCMIDDPSAWIVRRPRQPLLPALRRLQGFVIIHHISALAEIMVLLSSTLRDIEINMVALERAPRPLTEMLLEELQSVFADAESLTVAFPQSQSTLAVEKCGTFKHLRSLEITNWVSLSVHDMPLLMALQNLGSLGLYLHTFDDFGGSKFRDQPGFPELRELTLMGKLEAIHDFLVATSPPMLQTFVMQIRHFHHYLVGNISGKCTPNFRHRSPRRLEVSFHYQQSEQELGIPPSAALVETLHRLPCLQRLSFRFDGLLIGITNLILRRLKAVWPQLVVLEFTYPPTFLAKIDRRPSFYLDWETLDPPTITSILAFVAAHPRLERLALPYADARSVPPLDKPSVLHHNLRSLRILHLEEKVPLRKVALALDRAFPHLDLPDEDESIKCRGDELDSMIFALQTGRNASRVQLKKNL
ncbi:hypothetical protein LXA43DRAFT_894868 [Ganoderma leucocontextum]|nr:hypothetical protein LXA43DRAFT_894868 [Ganoderma leucocontextum]